VFRKKFFVPAVIISALFVVGIVALMDAFGSPAVQAAGLFPDDQNSSVKIQVLPNPVSLKLIGEEEGIQVVAKLYPGEETVFRYEITNLAMVEYIVDIRPVLSGGTDPYYWLNHEFKNQEGLQIGSGTYKAHLIVAPNGVTHIDLRVGSLRAAPEMEISINIAMERTNCTVLEGCPWAH